MKNLERTEEYYDKEELFGALFKEQDWISILRKKVMEYFCFCENLTVYEDAALLNLMSKLIETERALAEYVKAADI